MTLKSSDGGSEVGGEAGVNLGLGLHVVQGATFALARPTLEDVTDVYGLYSDERVFRHFPSGAFTRKETAQTMVRKWMTAWEVQGLGPYLVRDAASGDFLGNVGCRTVGSVWNLGYRLNPISHGKGVATSISRIAIQAARSVMPERPIVAYMVEDNIGSARVAAKSGLTFVGVWPDKGNPDATAMRVVYADRVLTPERVNEIINF